MQTRSASDLSPHSGRPARCPRCAAAVRGDVPWCLTCYARFDEAGAAAGTTAAEPSPPAAPESSPPAAPATTPSRPDDEPDPGREDLEAVAARMLAELAATRDRAGWAGRLPRSRAGRAVLVSVLLAGCSGVLLGAMQLVGLAL
jgi:pyruvate/2-oxoglutarate dehydrogenase complex dihydrolipoamide acyltransferase (E2) component